MAQIEMAKNPLHYLDIEYHELNNHVRESWKYISDLLKSFLFIQILLISLMFLGGGVIEVDGVDVHVKSAQHVSQNSNGSAPVQSEIDKQERNKQFVIFPLIFIGLAGSIGAMVQNRRLFTNATTFVRRAAYLEITGGFLEDRREPLLGGTSPPNKYMSENLYLGGRGFDYLKTLMTSTYFVFFCLWLYYAVRIGFNF